jgi:hypothetical protein
LTNSRPNSTGEPLSADAFTEYVTDKHGALYDL